MTPRTELRDRIGSLSPEALERLIYLVGPARGGTTVIKNVIGLHDSVMSFHGPSHFLNHAWRHRRRLRPRLWRIVYWLPSSLRQNLVRDSLDEERRAAFLPYVNQVLNRKDFRELYQLYPLVQALDPDEPRKPEEIVCWLDKGNDFWGVDLLPRYFPKALFVFVVRDPRGCITSLSRRFADARPDTEMQVEQRDVITSAIYWCNTVQRELRFAFRYPSRTILVRYEDLVTRPLSIIPQIYNHLDLPPMAEDTLCKKLDGLSYGASLSPQERGTGLSSKPVERWRTGLSQASLEIIADICGPTARRLGYELEQKTKSRGIREIAAVMPERIDQARTFAKLLYLRLREKQFGAIRNSVAPLRLLEEE